MTVRILLTTKKANLMTDLPKFNCICYDCIRNNALCVPWFNFGGPPKSEMSDFQITNQY